MKIDSWNKFLLSPTNSKEFADIDALLARL